MGIVLVFTALSACHFVSHKFCPSVQLSVIHKHLLWPLLRKVSLKAFSVCFCSQHYGPALQPSRCWPTVRPCLPISACVTSVLVSYLDHFWLCDYLPLERNQTLPGRHVLLSLLGPHQYFFKLACPLHPFLHVIIIAWSGSDPRLPEHSVIIKLFEHPFVWLLGILF